MYHAYLNGTIGLANPDDFNIYYSSYGAQGVLKKYDAIPCNDFASKHLAKYSEDERNNFKAAFDNSDYYWCPDVSEFDLNSATLYGQNFNLILESEGYHPYENVNTRFQSVVISRFFTPEVYN